MELGLGNFPLPLALAYSSTTKVSVRPDPHPRFFVNNVKSERVFLQPTVFKNLPWFQEHLYVLLILIGRREVSYLPILGVRFMARLGPLIAKIGQHFSLSKSTIQYTLD